MTKPGWTRAAVLALSTVGVPAWACLNSMERVTSPAPVIAATGWTDVALWFALAAWASRGLVPALLGTPGVAVTRGRRAFFLTVLAAVVLAVTGWSVLGPLSVLVGSDAPCQLNLRALGVMAALVPLVFLAQVAATTLISRRLGPAAWKTLLAAAALTVLVVPLGNAVRAQQVFPRVCVETKNVARLPAFEESHAYD